MKRSSTGKEPKCYFTMYSCVIGESRGVPPARPPPTGSNSFIFAYVFAKKCPHRRSAPPYGSVPPQWEILDPPLCVMSFLDLNIQISPVIYTWYQTLTKFTNLFLLLCMYVCIIICGIRTNDGNYSPNMDQSR